MVKIKEISITANYAWSPKSNHPVYIVAGTAAQQLDATFSSSASLQLFAIDITDSSLQAKCAGKVDVNDRFQKIVWGSKYTDSSQANGVVVCGTDKGGIEIYDPDMILASNADCLVLSTSKHTGPVRALDFNAFQNNLFASGANDSEIFIWDLNKPGNPMTPGKKSQPLSAISSIAWNKQVQHILSSTSTLSSGPCCVVWDLRKNEPIIKVQDPSGRMQCIDVAWHPEVATQLVLASEDDHAPVVQLWDLRFATSPMKVLEKHKRGVVSVSWCPQDPDLLLTCGKDNQVYCWNPNTTPPEVVSDLDTHAQWCFDVQWCPRNPNIVSSGSFDGHISVHSLMGGELVDETTVTDAQRNAVAEAFGSDAFPHEQQSNATVRKRSTGLKKPPKWMRRPCGANFSFGGKLVSFQHTVPDENQQKQVRRNVVINQVITENNLVARSSELLNALSSKAQCTAYCQQKIGEADNEFEEDLWNFIKVNFEANSNQQYLQLLGYNPADLKSKFDAFTSSNAVNGNLSTRAENLSLAVKGEVGDGSLSTSSSSNALDAFEQIAIASEANTVKPAVVQPPMIIPTDDNDAASLALPVVGDEPPRITRRHSSLAVLPGDLDSLISQALLVADYESAVELCFHGGRMADAILMASVGGPTLLDKTRKRYCTSSNATLIHRLLSVITTADWNDVVTSCDLNNWKEVLASLLTHASANDLTTYCDKLGERLETEEKLRIRACLCYICSGSIDKFVRCWDKIHATKDVQNADAMQNLVEKIMVLLHMVQGSHTGPWGENVSDKLSRYASTLAAQGQLAAAMRILPASSEKKSVQILRDRLFHSQGDAMAGQQPPLFPFSREGSQVVQRPSAQVQPQPYYQRTRKTHSQQTHYNQGAPAMPSFSEHSAVSTISSSVQQQPAPVQRSRDANPYANQSMQRSPYAVTRAPLPSIFTPAQTQAVASAPMHPISNTYPASAYQPTSSVSNGPSLMYPAERAPPLPTPDSHGDGSKQLQRPGGWNDPPILDPNRIPKKKKAAPVAFQPENLNIMTPMQPAISPPDPYRPGAPMHPPSSMPPVGMMQPHLPSQPSSGVPQGQMLGVVNQQQSGGVPQAQMLGVVNQQQSVAPPSMMQQAQQLPTTEYSEESDHFDYDSNEPTSSAPSVPTAALKDVPKVPIPSEHVVLQQSFDGLIKKCLSQATNAQMKRKLEDCSRRLEFLYDKLRANTLSPNILKGLHQVALSVGSRDYPNGLRHHTQIVTSSNFSEISAFMPGLKSLLQIAGSLRI